MVFAVQGRGGDSISRYDGSGGPPSFGPSGEDTLGAGGAGGVEDEYFSRHGIGGVNLSENPGNSSAGFFHWLFSKSPRVSSGTHAMMSCGAPAGGVGIPASAPSEVELVQAKEEAPTKTSPQVKEKNSCEIVLNALDAGAFGVLRVVTTYEETGYFMEGKETISPDQLHFRLVPATDDYGNYPFKEGHRLYLVYLPNQSPRDGVSCKNSSLEPKTNQMIADRTHNFLTLHGDFFEGVRGKLRSVGGWRKSKDFVPELWTKHFGSTFDALLAVFRDKRLARELSVSPVDVSENEGREEIEILWRRFVNVGIELQISGRDDRGQHLAIFSHIEDLAEGKGPKFFGFFEGWGKNCEPKIKCLDRELESELYDKNCEAEIRCLSFAHNYNEDLNFNYLGRNGKAPEHYNFTLSEDKILEGHKFPKGSRVTIASIGYWKNMDLNIDPKFLEVGFIKQMDVTLSRNTRIKDILFHKGSQLVFQDGKLEFAYLGSDTIIKGRRFKGGLVVHFEENGKVWRWHLPGDF